MDVAEDCKAILEVEYAKDKFACEIFVGTNHDDKYKVLEGIIYYKGISRKILKNLMILL